MTTSRALPCGNGWRTDPRDIHDGHSKQFIEVSTVYECAAACSSRKCCAVFKWNSGKRLCGTSAAGMWRLKHPELSLRQGSWHGNGWVTCVITQPALLPTDGCLLETSVSGMMLDAGLQTTLTYFRSAKLLRKNFSTSLENNISIAVVGSSGNLLDRRNGEAIDGADVVIRINNAPTTKANALDIGRGYPDRKHGLVRSGWSTGLNNAVSPSSPAHTDTRTHHNLPPLTTQPTANLSLLPALSLLTPQ